MPSAFIAESYLGPYDSDRAAEVAKRLRDELGASGNMAFVFCTRSYLTKWEEFSEILRVDGHITELVGSTGVGFVASSHEYEDNEGFSILALAVPDAEFSVVRLNQELMEESDGGAYWQMQTGFNDCNGAICLLNPFVFPCDTWLSEWNEAYPDRPCVGGLASINGNPQEAAVFHNGQNADGGVVVAFRGNLHLDALISQGCRPIGEPLTVTRAESNVIYSLGSESAYQVLESAFLSLSEAEKASAKGNLFAGLASSEYVEDFRPGDFLIRNIIGADPDSGAVVIGGYPRVGQTLQYQYRDRKAASADLEFVLNHAKDTISSAGAALVFTCSGRGKTFFKDDSHDAKHIHKAFPEGPSAGFFCNGEISFVQSTNCLNAYSVVIGLLRTK